MACKQNGAEFGGGEKDAWVICCQDSKMIKTNKLLRLKTKNGRLLDVVREHYLRKDVPCHSEICTGCEQGRKCNHDYFSQSEGSVGENLQIICRLMEFSYSLVVKKKCIPLLSGAPNENIDQNHLNIELLNVF